MKKCYIYEYLARTAVIKSLVCIVSTTNDMGAYRFSHGIRHSLLFVWSRTSALEPNYQTIARAVLGFDKTGCVSENSII